MAAKTTTKAKTKVTAKAKPKATSKASRVDELFDSYWESPDDTELLKVYADALAEAGDPRGTYIHLRLAGEPQADAAAAFQKRHQAALCGKAKGLFREVTFADNGLVAAARTEYDKVIANIDVLGRLNPHLMLTISSVRTVPDAQQLGAISLGRIFFVDFSGISGGGAPITDKQLVALAPALADVRCLALHVSGGPKVCISPDGLRTLAKHARRLEYLYMSFIAAGFHQTDYARAIGDSPGFSTLRAVKLTGVPHGDLGLAIPEGPRPSRDNAREIARAIS